METLKQTIKELKQKVDYTLFYSEFFKTPLNRTKFTTHCPFHNDKNPSFSVNLENGNWKCYSLCSKSGDFIDFYCQIKRLTFPEALNELCMTYNVTLPSEVTEELNKERTYHKLMDRVCSIFQKSLYENQSVIDFLVQRGISKDSMSKFRLGFCPGNLMTKMSEKNPNVRQSLLSLGIVKMSGEGFVYDHFRDRVTIPYINKNGSCVGFTSRLITEGQKAPKYMSLQANSYFKSTDLLYGIEGALPNVTKYRNVIVTEGVFDVISAQQNDIMSVVGISTLVPSESQLSRIRGMNANKIFLVVEDDKALSSLKDIYKKVSELCPYAVVYITDMTVLNEGKKYDLNDFFKVHNKSTFLDVIKKSKPYNMYMLDRLLASAKYTNQEEKIKVLNSLVKNHILEIKNTVLRRRYCDYVACILSLPVEDVYSVVSRREKYVYQEQIHFKNKSEPKIYVLSCFMLENLSKTLLLTEIKKHNVKNKSFNTIIGYLESSILKAKKIDTDLIDEIILSVDSDAKEMLKEAVFYTSLDEVKYINDQNIASFVVDMLGVEE